MRRRCGARLRDRGGDGVGPGLVVVGCRSGCRDRSVGSGAVWGVGLDAVAVWRLWRLATVDQVTDPARARLTAAAVDGSRAARFAVEALDCRWCAPTHFAVWITVGHTIFPRVTAVLVRALVVATAGSTLIAAAER